MRNFLAGRYLAGLVAIASFLGGSTGTARGQAVLDQSFDPTCNPNGLLQFVVFGAIPNGIEHAQTFVAGVSGPLTRADFWVQRLGAANGTLIADIRGTDAAGAPDPAATPAGVLATDSVPAVLVSTTVGWVSFTFNPPATVVAGQKYAVVLRASGTNYDWEGTGLNQYPAGTPYTRTIPGPWVSSFPNEDLGFRTFVGNAPYPPPPGCGGAGVTIIPSGASTDVTEGGAGDTYSVVLNTVPTANVTVNLNAGTQVTMTPAALTFTPANWNVPQTVTVTAVDDALVEGPHTGTITHTATSAMPAYNGIAIASVTVNITDNDSGTPGGPPSTPGGAGEGGYGGGTGPASPEGSFAQSGRARQQTLRGPLVTLPGQQLVLNASHENRSFVHTQSATPVWAIGGLVFFGVMASLSALKIAHTLIRLLRKDYH